MHLSQWRLSQGHPCSISLHASQTQRAPMLGCAFAWHQACINEPDLRNVNAAGSNPQVGLSPVHGLMGVAGEDGSLECFDPRQRAAVGTLSAAAAAGAVSPLQ